MDRRKFFSVTSAGAAAAAASSISSAQAQQQQQWRKGATSCASGKLPLLKVKLGHQFGTLTERSASWVARYGVDEICTSPVVTDPTRLYPTPEEMRKMLDLATKWKLNVGMVDSVLLTSSHIDDEKNPAIMLAQSPQRDRDIEAFQNHIRTCAATGIKTIKYNMSLLGVVRSEHVPGRGDTVYEKWDAKAALTKNPPLTKAGVVGADAFWERIDYFLKRVVPVAAENKVRIACHPQDPGTPPEGYQGITNVLGTIDGMKRFISMYENPYHGFNFCQGTVSENLVNPKTELFDVIRYFGSRKKIFNVHFRNITGGRDNFVAEMFPDEGDVDFVQALKVYREVGYEDMLMPDHAPAVPGDAREVFQRENFPFAFGYIRGLMQAERSIT